MTTNWLTRWRTSRTCSWSNWCHPVRRLVRRSGTTSSPGKLRAASASVAPSRDPETSQHVGDHEDRRQHHQTEKDSPYHAPHENLPLIRIIPLPSYPFPGVPRRELSVN
jgi:hypothetical protein